MGPGIFAEQNAEQIFLLLDLPLKIGNRFRGRNKRVVAIDLRLVRSSNRDFQGTLLVSGLLPARPVCASRFRVGCRAPEAGK